MHPPDPQVQTAAAPLPDRGRRRLIPAALGIGVMCLLLGGLLPIERWYRASEEHDERADVSEHVAGVASVLSADVSERLSLVQGLAAYVKANPTDEINPRDFETYASGLYSPGKNIRVLQLAPQGVVRLNYPVAGNEQSIGRNLLSDPDPRLQWEISESIRTRQMVVGRPTALWQGGFGIVVRQAVFRGDHLWGIVNVVLDLPPIIAAAERPLTAKLDFAFRDDLGRVFSGDQKVFDRSPAVTQVQFPGRRWEIAAAPRAGWNAGGATQLLMFRLLGFGVVVLAGATAYLIAGQQAWLRRAVAERTASLELARQRFDAAVAGANDGLWDCDMATQTLFWSPRYKQMLGYDPGDPIQPSRQAWESRLHPEDRERALEAVDAMLNRRTPYSVEYRLQTEAGSYRWFLARGQAVYDESGKPLRMAGSLSDIHERKLAEESLRASEAKFRNLAESANAMICVVVDRQIVYANPYASELTGYTREEMLGRRFVDFVHPDWQAPIELNLARYNAGGGWPGLFETVVLRKDGALRWVEVSSSAVPFKGALMVTGIAVDITERKRIEADLDDRLRFESMVADLSASLMDVAAPDVAAAIDDALRRVGEFLDIDRITLTERAPDGEPRRLVFSRTFCGQPVECGSTMEQLHPWTCQQVDAGQFVAFSTLDELPPEAAVDRATWERRGTRSMLVVPITLGGEYRFGLSVATVSREKKWPEHLVQRLRVLGQILANAMLRGRMDRELQNRAEMLRSLNTELSRTEDRARRKLAAVLHDDLAQNIFGTSAELIAIRNTCPEAMQIALDRVLAKLDESLKQARDLTYDLCPPLLYEAGLVPALLKLAERFTRQHDIAFSITSDAVDGNIDSDLASLLYQGVRELFINVARHSRAKRATASVEQTEAGLAITVSDDGVGCPDAENKINAGGTGFGLFNIRERLRSLDGQLTVGNAPGGGCVVRLSVPVHAVTI